MPLPVNVGLTLSGPRVARRVASAVHASDGHATVLAWSAILPAIRDGSIDALIYDLEPGGPPAADVVSGVRRVRRHLPIWLYHPLRSELADLAARLALFPGVVATPQLATGADDIVVRPCVRALLSAVPRVRLERLMATLIGSQPPAVWDFVDSTLERLAQGGPQALRVQQIVAETGVGLRSLEVLCKASSLPRPKQLLDHLVLVYVTFMRWSGAAPLAPGPQHTGMLDKDLSRIRSRVIRSEDRWDHLSPVDQFALAAIALGRACNLAAPAVRDMVEGFVLESAG